MIRRPASVVAIAACLIVTVACDGGEPTPSPTQTPLSAPTTATSPPSAPPSPSVTASPSGTPATSPTPDDAVLVSISPDTRAADVDVDELVPDRSDVTGRWIGRVGATEQLVVAVAGEGNAFARDRSLWRWTPDVSLDGWLGVPVLEYPARRGVLNVDAVVTDVTGDGDDDALVFALTGGSGGCGIWSVVDLASARSVYRRDLCDGTIDPSAEPVGLVVRESVYRPGDPHCCPSARRETVLTYDDAEGDWKVFRRETTDV